MKKILITLSIAILGFVNVNAQSSLPKGCNSNIVDGSIQANAAQEWDLAGTSYTAVNYFVAPEAPYLTGTLTVSYIPHCEPNELCIQIIRAEVFNITIVNDNGNCVVNKQ